MSEELLSKLDWNFDAVPDSELVACCYWEYARESAFIRDTLSRYRKEIPAGRLVKHGSDGRTRASASERKNRSAGTMAEGELPKSWKNLERIQSIGCHANVFVQGCALEAGVRWQSKDQNKPNYRHPDAPPITPSFPAPWQSLAGPERAYRSHLRTGKGEPPPVRMADWPWAKDIARFCQDISDHQYEKQKEWERLNPRKDAKGQAQATHAEDMPSFKPIRAGLRWGVCETVLVDIAWAAFTDEEIVSYVRQWLKSARPVDMKAPSGQGHKPGDWRANLTRLAVMRLLSRSSPIELLDPRKKRFPEIWETKQFAALKWGDPTKWRDARREAGRFFRKLFPFLPPGELPLSWQRRAPGK